MYGVIRKSCQSLFSMRKMARRSKLVERQQQIQQKTFLPEENSTTFQTCRAAMNNTNRRLSSLKKTAPRSKLVEQQRTIQDFLLEHPQPKRSRFVNSSLTVTLVSHFNETKKNKRALSTLKNCLGCHVTGNIKTTQNYRPLQIYAHEVSRDIM